MEIKWIQPVDTPKMSRSDKYDVTIEKDTKTKTRLKIAIENTVLDGMPINPRMMVGLAGTRMYLKFSDTDGYAIEKMKERLATTVSIRNGIEHFTGGYTLHRSAEDLVFIDLKEKK